MSYDNIRQQDREVYDAMMRELRLGDQVCITFYQDTEYISPSGRITGIDGINRLIFLSGRPIPIDDIASVSRCAVQNDTIFFAAARAPTIYPIILHRLSLFNRPES